MNINCHGGVFEKLLERRKILINKFNILAPSNGVEGNAQKTLQTKSKRTLEGKHDLQSENRPFTWVLVIIINYPNIQRTTTLGPIITSTKEDQISS